MTSEASENRENAVDSDVEEQPVSMESYSRIDFPNGNTARMIKVSVNDEPDDFLNKLGMSLPKALIVVVTGAKEFDDAMNPRLRQLFSRGIARAAANINAAIIDGGTQSGGMAMMGESVADRGYKSPLIGVAPEGKVTWPDPLTKETDEPVPNKTPLDPNHTHFILAETPTWGGETPVMFRFIEHLKKRHNIPVITVLVNGGPKTRAEVVRCVRMDSSLIVFKGSGRLADEIAALHEDSPEFIENPELAEIVQEGRIYLFPVESSINALERLISRQVRSDSVLKLAWSQFAIYDKNAELHKNSFVRIQNLIILLGVLGTTLAVVQSCFDKGHLVHDILHYIIVTVPILLSIFLAASNEFKPGNKWLLLRGSAEVLKSEIFCHRTRIEIRDCQEPESAMPEAKLTERLEQISTRLMQTEVNLSALKAYDGPLPPMYATGPGDDGFSRLTPEHYLTSRLEDQLNFYIAKTAQVEKKLLAIEWLIYIGGGVGTLLAAIGMEIWVALTNSLVAAFGAYMKYQMLQESLTKYNQAATALTNVRSWWISLSAGEQAKAVNINLLVENTEGILRSEFSSWVQEMEDRIAQLQKEQEGDADADTENADGKKRAGETVFPGKDANSKPF